LRKRLIALTFALAAAVLTLVSSAGAHRSVVQTIAVTAGKPSEFKFTVVPKQVRHGAVVFRITNSATSTLPHDFKICSSPKGSLTKNSCAGKATKTLSPGVKAALTYIFKTKGTYEYLCTVPGHAAAGTKGLLKVT
jgi:uncharacterized cupredoxin-like copper-binding protein